MFRTVPLSIVRSFSLYTEQWYMSYSLRTGSGRNCSSVLIHILKFIFGIKLYMFRTVPLSIVRSFSLYTQQWYMPYSLRTGSGRNCSSVLIHILKFIFGIKFYMFRTVPLSIVRSFSLYTQQWYMSYSLRTGSGRNCSSVLIHILKFIFVIKLYMFRTVPLSIVRSFSLYTQQLCMSYRFADILRTGSGRNCTTVLILFATCMTYTIAVCTVKNC